MRLIKFISTPDPWGQWNWTWSKGDTASLFGQWTRTTLGSRLIWPMALLGRIIKVGKVYFIVFHQKSSSVGQRSTKFGPDFTVKKSGIGMRSPPAHRPINCFDPWSNRRFTVPKGCASYCQASNQGVGRFG